MGSKIQTVDGNTQLVKGSASLGEKLFLTAYLVAATFPFIRFWIGPIPVYLQDVLIVLAGLLIIQSTKRGAKIPYSQLPQLLIGLLIISIFVLWMLTGEFNNIAYRNGRRILAIFTFFICSGICLNFHGGRKRIERVIIAGLLLHSCMVVGQVVLFLLAPNLLIQLDDFYYQTLSSMAKASRTTYWTLAWYIPRAYGGYWNPNSATAALILPLPLIVTLSKRSHQLTAVIIIILSLLLTGSRQGLVVILILLAVIIFLIPKRYFIEIGKASIILGALPVALVAIVIFQNLLPTTEQRLRNEYAVDTLDVSAEARLNNYNDYFNYIFIEHPEYLFFGQGVDFINIKAQSNISVEYGGGFVSNSWLLLISQQGIFAFLIFFLFFINFLISNDNPFLRLSLLGFGIIGLFDNHVAVYESLQVIFWVIAGLCATSAKQRGSLYSQAKRFGDPNGLSDPDGSQRVNKYIKS